MESVTRSKDALEKLAQKGGSGKVVAKEECRLQEGTPWLFCF